MWKSTKDMTNAEIKEITELLQRQNTLLKIRDKMLSGVECDKKGLDWDEAVKNIIDIEVEN